MSGRLSPLTCCDRDCAMANDCIQGGYQCRRCEQYFCAYDMDDVHWFLCADCAEAVEAESDK